MNFFRLRVIWYKTTIWTWRFGFLNRTGCSISVNFIGFYNSSSELYSHMTYVKETVPDKGRSVHEFGTQSPPSSKFWIKYGNRMLCGNPDSSNIPHLYWAHKWRSDLSGRNMFYVHMCDKALKIISTSGMLLCNGEKTDWKNNFIPRMTTLCRTTHKRYLSPRPNFYIGLSKTVPVKIHGIINGILVNVKKKHTLQPQHLFADSNSSELSQIQILYETCFQ
jgi:hypothetical protein